MKKAILLIVLCFFVGSIKIHAGFLLPCTHTIRCLVNSFDGRDYKKGEKPIVNISLSHYGEGFFMSFELNGHKYVYDFIHVPDIRREERNYNAHYENGETKDCIHLIVQNNKYFINYDRVKESGMYAVIFKIGSIDDGKPFAIFQPLKSVKSDNSEAPMFMLQNY